MPKWWDTFRGRLAITRTLFQFLWAQRLWWMIPLICVLLLIGVLLTVAQQSAIAPFIYTLF